MSDRCTKFYPASRQLVAKHIITHWPPALNTSPRFLLIGNLVSIHNMPFTQVISFTGTEISFISHYLLSTEVRYEVVVLHVGSNCCKSQTFMSEFIELIAVVKQRSIFVDTEVWICSLLPRPFDCGEIIVIEGIEISVDDRLVSLNKKLRNVAEKIPCCTFLKTYMPFRKVSDPAVRAMFSESGYDHLLPIGWLRLRRFILGALHNFHPQQSVPILK